MAKFNEVIQKVRSECLNESLDFLKKPSTAPKTQGVVKGRGDAGKPDMGTPKTEKVKQSEGTSAPVKVKNTGDQVAAKPEMDEAKIEKVAQNKEGKGGPVKVKNTGDQVAAKPEMDEAKIEKVHNEKIKMAKSLKEAFDNGVIDKEELKAKVSALIDQYPEALAVKLMEILPELSNEVSTEPTEDLVVADDMIQTDEISEDDEVVEPEMENEEELTEEDITSDIDHDVYAEFGKPGTKISKEQADVIMKKYSDPLSAPVVKDKATGEYILEAKEEQAEKTVGEYDVTLYEITDDSDEEKVIGYELEIKKGKSVYSIVSDTELKMPASEKVLVDLLEDEMEVLQKKLIQLDALIGEEEEEVEEE